MVDESGLDGLDPYDLMDSECERLTGWFDTLDAAGWDVPSHCEGWSRRDLLAHLVAVEEYFEACLSGTVADLMKRYTDAGAGSIDDFNAAGVAASADTDPAELLAGWVAHNARNRAGFRAADGGDIDTSVGGYPGRLQSFHVVHEYATHANDVDAPVGADEYDERQAYLAAISRFALTELKKDLSISDVDGGFIVANGDMSVTLDRDEFVLGVSGRFPEGTFEPEIAALLDLGY
ncbi:MAG: maleylpyruvate isomerase family mycothiol-dependent enzyme [Acidimicrobiales bacterium]